MRQWFLPGLLFGLLHLIIFLFGFLESLILLILGHLQELSKECVSVTVSVLLLVVTEVSVEEFGEGMVTDQSLGRPHAGSFFVLQPKWLWHIEVIWEERLEASSTEYSQIDNNIKEVTTFVPTKIYMREKELNWDNKKSCVRYIILLTIQLLTSGPALVTTNSMEKVTNNGEYVLATRKCKLIKHLSACAYHNVGASESAQQELSGVCC